MPWLAVEKEYEFDGPKGKASLLDLFEGRRQLIVYRAFFEPGVHGWPDHACPGCSLVADQVAHLEDDPLKLSTEVDWVIKQQLIQAYMEKNRLSWRDPKVSLMDLQYHDIRPSKGLYYKLEESDAVERMTTEDEVTKAIYDPPKDTRAYFRGRCISKYPEAIAAAVRRLLRDPALRRRACPVPDFFVDVPYEGEIVRARARDGKLELHEGGTSFVTLPRAAFDKEHISPTRDTRLRWMQSIIRCTHYVTGQGEQVYLDQEEVPDVTFVRRETVWRTFYNRGNNGDDSVSKIASCIGQ